MKEGWIYKKIKDVAVVVGGTTPSTANPEFWGGDLCWISPAELHGEHYLYDSVKKITAKAVASKSLKELPVGTVILSSRAPIGKVAINKVPMYCNQGFKCVICGPDLLNEYLYWWFRGKKDYLNSLGTGATFAEISKTVVENISIPVPPLPEQQRIVSRLDTAFANIDALKANATRQLSEARILFQKALEEAMTPKEGWEEKTIGAVIDHLRTGLNPRTYFKLNTPDAECYYITVRELKGFTINPDEKTDKVNRAAIKRINERSSLKIGDVLFSGTGTIGKTALVSELPEKWNIKEGVYAMTPKHSELDSKYFIYYIGSEFFLRLVNDKAAGTGVRSIPMKELVKLPIHVPPLSTQRSIVTRLDSLSANIRALEEVLQKIIAECNALKQAMLRQVFE